MSSRIEQIIEEIEEVLTETVNSSRCQLPRLL